MFKENETKLLNNSEFPNLNREVVLLPDENLAIEQKDLLAKELTPLTAEGFMRDISTESLYETMYKDVFNHVVPCDRLVVFRSCGKSQAFISTSLKDDIYHLEGIIVTPALHGKGFSFNALKHDMDECGSNILAFHTQSMLMFNLGKKLADFDISLSRELAMSIGTRNLIDLPTGPIDKSRYGGASLYGDLTKFDPIAIKYPGFNYLEGDAVIFAGRIKGIDVK